MKKITCFCLFLLSSLGFAQVAEPVVSFPKNEFKGNALFLVLGAPEFTYERLLNDESGIGISVNFALENDFETRFSLTPYYRFYFGKKPAAGFFVEGFTMLNVIDIDENYYYNGTDPVVSDYNSESYADVAIGIGLGSKWITKRGILFELSGGIGRNLLNSEKNDYLGHTFVGRFGITLGYRF